MNQKLFENVKENQFKLIKESTNRVTYEGLVKYLKNLYKNKVNNEEELNFLISVAIYWFASEYELDNIRAASGWNPDTNDKGPEDYEPVNSMYNDLVKSFGDTDDNIQKRIHNKIFSGKNFYLKVIDKKTKQSLGSVVNRNTPSGDTINDILNDNLIVYGEFKWDDFFVLYFGSLEYAKKASLILSQHFKDLAFIPTKLELMMFGYNQ